MLIQNDPYRDVETLFSRLSGRQTASATMPMDSYRRGSDVWVHLDLPGVSADVVDITVERNVLTVTAERTVPRQDGDQIYLAERHRGTFRRQVHLGEGLDAAALEADLHDGVLTLRIPVAERAKPRKVAVNAARESIETTTTDAVA